MVIGDEIGEAGAKSILVDTLNQERQIKLARIYYAEPSRYIPLSSQTTERDRQLRVMNRRYDEMISKIRGL